MRVAWVRQEMLRSAMSEESTAHRAQSLNFHAAPFIPQSKSSAAIDSQASAPAQIEGNAVVEKRLPKVQTSRSGVYKSLDQVPFTPGQGIVTPSPTNMATYWYQAQYLGYTDPYSGFPAVWSPHHQFPVATPPGSPMYATSSLASAASMFYMSQSSGSPNFAYPYTHWYWPQGASSVQAMPLLQSHHSHSHRTSSGSPRGSSDSMGSSSSPGYSPTAAAAAAGMHGHRVYTMHQGGSPLPSMNHIQYHQQAGGPGWQQGFLQGLGYGQPMRAYRSPTRTPSRSPPNASSNANAASSSSTDQPHSLSQTGPKQGPAQPPSESPGSGSSHLSPLTPPQADATVNARVQRSFLSAAKHGRSSPRAVQQGPLKGNLGPSLAYSASSEDAASTSGANHADESSSIEAFEELCAAWRGLGGSIQEAPQQLLDLTELMQSYGMPTPGWDSKSPARGGTSPQQQGLRRQFSGHSASLQIPGSSPYKLNARQRRTLRRAVDRAKQAIVVA